MDMDAIQGLKTIVGHYGVPVDVYYLEYQKKMVASPIFKVTTEDESIEYGSSYNFAVWYNEKGKYCGRFNSMEEVVEALPEYFI